MRLFEGQSFRGFIDRDSAAVFSDIEFRGCTFEGCYISVTRDPALRSTVRNVILRDCTDAGNVAGCPIIEDVLIEHLRIEGDLMIWGAVFKHVTLCGRIGPVMISTFLPAALGSPEEIRPLNQANARYYASVNWALDISRAEFADCDIRGIPARLIRRDAETQVVITREKAMKGEWRQLDLERTYWRVAIEFMLDRGDADAVLVAPKRARRFKELLAGLELLRKAGVAEPE